MSELLSKDQIFTRMNLEDWSSVEALLSCPQEAALESRTKNVPIRNAKWIIHGTMGVGGEQCCDPTIAFKISMPPDYASLWHSYG